MAEENLGTAVLKIVVDDDQARATLDKLKSDIRQVETGVSRTTSTRTSSRATSGPSAPAGLQFGSISRQDVSRFNLRGFTASLQSIADDFNNVATARNVNINSSWTKALALLSETKEDIDLIAASKNINLQNSWTKALALLSETKEDIDLIAASKNINLQNSWTKALLVLNETKEDIDAIAATKRINIKSSWAKALDFLDETAQIISDTARQRDIQEGLRIGLQNAVPIRGGAAFPGSPAFLDSIFPSFPKEYFAKQAREVKAASQKQQGIISNAIIGGAFPLLFGQGIGASIGGAAGGAAGGAIGGQFGFGLSLVGTALGTQFDLAIQKSSALAKALDDPIGQFSALQQNALLSSKSVEKQVEALIAVGRTAEAAVVIQQDLAQVFGNQEAAKEYLNATDELNRAWSEATVTLAGFVAGPLAAFLRGITGGVQASNAAERVRQQRSGLTPAQNQQISAFRNRRSRELGLGDFATDLEALQLNLDTSAEINKITGETAKNQSLIAAIRKQDKQSLSLSYQLINASTQGYERQTLELKKQEILQERNRKLLNLTEAERKDPNNVKVRDINEKAALEEYTISQQLVNLDKDRAAQQGLEAAQNNIKLQSINKQIAATQALSKAERGVARDTLATTQNIQAGIDAAKDREREIGAQIDAARQRGGDAGEQEAFRLVQEQKVTANQTRLELEKGALALKEAGEQLRDNLRGAVVEFTRVRSDPQGLNRFLNPVQRQQRAEFDFKTLLPEFRIAQERFTQLTGQRAPEFRGPTAGVNEAIRDFINSVQNEREVTRNLLGVNQAIATNTAQLNTTNADLAAKIKELADKDWTINLTQNSSGQWQASGDAKSQAELRAASTL